jgi:serralysin
MVDAVNFSGTLSYMSNLLPSLEPAPEGTPSSSLISPLAPHAGAAGVATVSATGDRNIDGLLFGTKWTGSVTFSFPDSRSDYPAVYGDGEPDASGFAQVSPQEQKAYKQAMAQIERLTNIDISYAGTGKADIQIAHSDAANPTAYAYFPWDSAAGGDIWIGNEWDYTKPKLGDYNYVTVLHEVGHSFGLKNAHSTVGYIGTTVPRNHDALEYTIESYRSYIGDSTAGGYTPEEYGFPTTYMMNDIAALQTLYGADYSTRGTNTTYSWDPKTGQQFINGVGQGLPGGGTGGASANRVFMTVWDGGGKDTFDLSAYTSNLNINLAPGGFSVLSDVQRAYLGEGHYAQGNVYNAYLHNDDPRSLIENVIGGRGDDGIIGNTANNLLTGGSGRDGIDGGEGNDTIDGGRGEDFMRGGKGVDTVSYSSAVKWVNISLLLGEGLTGKTLDDFMEFENAIGSAFNDKITGSRTSNVLNGGAGNDVLAGIEGADSLIGGDGIDIADYQSDPTGIVASLLNPSGNTGHAAGDVYRTVEGISGGIGNDTITGNNGANILKGNQGADHLNGLRGDDSLYGGAGADVISGGRGLDLMKGGLGRDIFTFSAVLESSASTGEADQITDFMHSVDRIDVSPIDAISGGSDDSFTYIGSAEFTAAGQIRAIQLDSDTLVILNTDGADSGEMCLRLLNHLAVTLDSDDFIL